MVVIGTIVSGASSFVGGILGTFIQLGMLFGLGAFVIMSFTCAKKGVSIIEGVPQKCCDKLKMQYDGKGDDVPQSQKVGRTALLIVSLVLMCTQVWIFMLLGGLLMVGYFFLRRTDGDMKVKAAKLYQKAGRCKQGIYEGIGAIKHLSKMPSEARHKEVQDYLDARQGFTNTRKIPKGVSLEKDYDNLKQNKTTPDINSARANTAYPENNQHYEADPSVVINVNYGEEQEVNQTQEELKEQYKQNFKPNRKDVDYIEPIDYWDVKGIQVSKQDLDRVNKIIDEYNNCADNYFHLVETLERLAKAPNRSQEDMIALQKLQREIELYEFKRLPEIEESIDQECDKIRVLYENYANNTTVEKQEDSVKATQSEDIETKKEDEVVNDFSDLCRTTIETVPPKSGKVILDKTQAAKFGNVQQQTSSDKDIKENEKQDDNEELDIEIIDFDDADDNTNVSFGA